MKTKLLKGLDKPSADKARADFIGSAAFRNNLKRVLNEEINTVRNSMEDGSLLEQVNVSQILLNKVAEIKALKTVVSLISEK